MDAPVNSHSQKELLQTLAQQMRRLERSNLGRPNLGRPHLAVSLLDANPNPNPQNPHVTNLPGTPPDGQTKGCLSQRRDHVRTTGVRTTGVSALDGLLEEGGLPAGCLMEWLEPGIGAGVDTLALWGAARARRPNELLIVIDSRGDFYPPGGASLGLDLQTTAVIRPGKSAEAIWTLEQSLRTQGVGVVVCPWRRFSSRTFRRLQLAAETGGSLGILLRPARARAEPSFAEVRWGVQSLPSAETGARRWRVELIRARRQMAGGSVELELRDDGDRLHLVSAMAAATDPLEAAGVCSADA